MKKILLALCVIAVAFTNAQIIFHVGPAQTYTTIQAAYNAFPATISSPYIIQLESGYNSLVETFPITFDARAGTNAIRTITLRPGVSGLVLASAVADGNIVFSGASYVIIDGRVNGIGTPDLTVINSNTAGNCFKINNNSSNCTMQYCKITGVNLNEQGLIYFENSGSSRIIGNEISGYGTNDCTTFIGTDPQAGSINNVTVYSNTFSNFLHSYNSLGASSSMAAIRIHQGAGSGWIIRANHFYEKDSVTISNTQFNNILAGYIFTDNSNIISYIDSNYFGGSTVFCGGNAMSVKKIRGSTLTVRMFFNAIDIGNGGGFMIGIWRTVVRANTFRNIYWDVMEGTLINTRDNELCESNQFGATAGNDTTYFKGPVTFIAGEDTIRNNHVNRTTSVGTGFSLIKSSRIAIGNTVGSNQPGDSVVVSGLNTNVFYGSEEYANACFFYYNHIEQLHAPDAASFANAREAIGNTIKNADVDLLFSSSDNSSYTLNHIYKNNRADSIQADGIMSLSICAKDSMLIGENKFTNIRMSGSSIINLITAPGSGSITTGNTRIYNNIFQHISMSNSYSNFVKVDYRTRSFKVEGNRLSDIRTYAGGSPSIFYLDPKSYVSGVTTTIRGNIVEDIRFAAPPYNATPATRYGIYLQKGPAAIEDNSFINISDSLGGMAVNFTGINVQDSLESCKRNIIHNVVINSPALNPTALKGISWYDWYDTVQCSGNKISSLVYTPQDSRNVKIIGVEHSNNTQMDRNFIGYLINNSSHSSSYTAAVVADGLNYELFTNNIIVLGSDTLGNALSIKNSTYGIFTDDRIQRAEFNHNTIYIRGTAINGGIKTACFSDTSSMAPTNLKLYNNVLWNGVSFSGNTTSHRTYLLSSLLNTSMDFNDYWKDGAGDLGSFNGGTTNQNTLQDIKTILIGQNIASVSSAPALVNPIGSISSINMAPTGTPLTGAGFYFVAVPRDHYGINRGNPPSIGAIELAGYVNPQVVIQSSGCLPNSTSSSITIQQITPLQWTNYTLQNSIGSTVSSGSFTNATTTISNLATGYYTLTFTNSGSGKNTSQTIYIPISVSPVLNVSSSATPACGSGTGTAQVVATGGTSPYLYSGIGATNSTGSYSSLAAGAYIVNVTSNEGCTGTVSFSVASSPLPTIPVITPAGATTFCSGGNVTLTSSTAYAYLWSNGTTTSSISVTSSGSYLVTAYNSVGCGSASVPLTVTVNPLPNATITPSGSLNLCSGQSVTLSVSSGNSYLWSNNLTTSSITVSQAGAYIVTVTSANNCSAVSSITNVTQNSAVTPTVTVSADKTTICAGETVNFTAAPINGGNSPSYLWYKNGTSVGFSSNPYSTSSISNGDAFSVRLTSNAPCANPTQVTSTPVAITVTSPPTPIISQSGNILTSNSPTGNQWYLNGSPLNGATTQNYTPAISGNYTVIVTSGSCTSQTSNVISVTISSIEEQSAENISVYPNPATNQLTITLNGLQVEQVSIYNVDGKLLTQTKQPANNHIDISNLANGVYIAEIKTKEGSVKRRWVKM